MNIKDVEYQKSNGWQNVVDETLNTCQSIVASNQLMTLYRIFGYAHSINLDGKYKTIYAHYDFVAIMIMYWVHFMRRD